MVGSHRDLHPTNIMRVDAGQSFMHVDWDAAGRVVPRHEVPCFALVFVDLGDEQGYAPGVTCAFIDGYRDSGGNFTFLDSDDLVMLVRGRLWWAEQNLRMALAPEAGSQHRLSAILLREVDALSARLQEMCAVLSECS